MGTLQQLLAQSVQQSMGLGEILTQKRQEAAILGETMQKVSELETTGKLKADLMRTEAQQKGQDYLFKQLETGRKEGSESARELAKTKASAELKRQKFGAKEEEAKREYSILSARSPEELKKVSGEITPGTEQEKLSIWKSKKTKEKEFESKSEEKEKESKRLLEEKEKVKKETETKILKKKKNESNIYRDQKIAAIVAADPMDEKLFKGIISNARAAVKSGKISSKDLADIQGKISLRRSQID